MIEEDRERDGESESQTAREVREARGKVGKGVRNRAESDMLEGEAGGKGEGREDGGARAKERATKRTEHGRDAKRGPR